MQLVRRVWTDQEPLRISSSWPSSQRVRIFGRAEAGRRKAVVRTPRCCLYFVVLSERVEITPAHIGRGQAIGDCLWKALCRRWSQLSVSGPTAAQGRGHDDLRPDDQRPPCWWGVEEAAAFSLLLNGCYLAASTISPKGEFLTAVKSLKPHFR